MEKQHAVRYSVQNLKDLKEIITPFFNKYNLRDKKIEDFKLWSEAINILFNNQEQLNIKKGTRGFTKKEWDTQELNRLITIRRKMLRIKAGRSNDFRYGKESLNNFIHS